MLKPDRLRELLTQTLSHFAHNPDKLILQFDAGQIHATGANSHSFEYAYNLEIIAVDFPFHPNIFFVPILEFLRIEQQELLFNPDRRGEIKFEIDRNNQQTYDIFISLPLTERVIVREENGNYTAKHANEPQLTDHLPLLSLNVINAQTGELVFKMPQEAKNA